MQVRFLPRAQNAKTLLDEVFFVFCALGASDWCHLRQESNATAGTEKSFLPYFFQAARRGREHFDF